jgi:hypothetical protein
MSSIQHDKYKKWRYETGERVVWAGMSATVEEDSAEGRVKLRVHRQLADGVSLDIIEAYRALAMVQDVSYPYPTASPNNGWVWEDLE